MDKRLIFSFDWKIYYLNGGIQFEVWGLGLINVKPDQLQVYSEIIGKTLCTTCTGEVVKVSRQAAACFF